MITHFTIFVFLPRHFIICYCCLFLPWSSSALYFSSCKHLLNCSTYRRRFSSSSDGPRLSAHLLLMLASALYRISFTCASLPRLDTSLSLAHSSSLTNKHSFSFLDNASLSSWIYFACTNRASLLSRQGLGRERHYLCSYS